MIKEMLIFPAFIVLFLGFSTQLIGLAETSSSHVLDFTLDMENAISCAGEGVDLTVCSPNIYSHSEIIDSDITDATKLNEKIKHDLITFLDDIEYDMELGINNENQDINLNLYDVDNNLNEIGNSLKDINYNLENNEDDYSYKIEETDDMITIYIKK